MAGDEQRDDFAAFVDGELFPPHLWTCNLMEMNTDEHTPEDLLSQHEHEIARLKVASPAQNAPADVDREVHRDLRRREGAQANSERSNASSRKGRGTRSWKIASGREDTKEGGEGEAQGFVNFCSCCLVLLFNMLPPARTAATFITAHMGERKRTVIPRAWRKHAVAAYGEYIIE